MGAMKFIISGKNIEVTEGIKAAIEEKLVERGCDPDPQ